MYNIIMMNSNFQLKDAGFGVVDAIEPSPAMVEQAKQQNIYRKYYLECVGKNRLPIENGKLRDRR